MTLSFISIHDIASFDIFVHEVDTLHDSIVREIGIVSRGFVDSSGFMHGDVAPTDMRMILHSQNESSPCIELVFEDIDSFSLQTKVDLQPNVEFRDDEISFYFLEGRMREQFMVKCKKIRYRIHDNFFVGREPRTVEPIIDNSDY